MPDGEDRGARPQRPGRDFVEDAVILRVLRPVEADRPGFLIHEAVDHAVDIDQERIDIAEGGGAGRVGNIARAPAGAGPQLEQRAQFSDAPIIIGIEHRPRRLRQLLLGQRVGAAADGLPQRRQGADRTEDRLDRLRRRQDQRQIGLPQDGAERRVDLADILHQPRLLAFLAALRPGAGGAVVDGGLAYRARRVLGHVLDLDHRGRQVGRNLHEPDLVFRQRQHMGGMGEGHRPQQRLEMETVRHLDGRGQPVGQPIGADIFRRGEDGQAMGLEAPEFIVCANVLDMLLHSRDRLLVDGSRLGLFQRVLEQIAELDPACLHILRHRRGRQITRNGKLRPDLVKLRNVPGGGDIQIKHSRFPSYSPNSR